MPSEQGGVSKQQCEAWRVTYREGKSPYDLAVEHDRSRRTVYKHLAGECAHDLSEPPISRGRTHNMSVAECRDMRERYAGGDAIETLQESTGRRWKTPVRHLTGNCSHTGVEDAPTVEKQEILKRDRVTADECAALRREVRDAATVRVYADTVEHDYHVVLAHVNGECTHSVDEPPRQVDERRPDISQATCQAIRQAYRASPETDFQGIAEEYECSPTTVERHVMFRCSHPPVDALVTDVDAVQDLLDSPNEDNVL